VAGFGTEAINPQLTRTVTDNWSLDPVTAPEKLEAMRCACRWVTIGPERACTSCLGLLSSPEQDHSPGRHFGVADRLARLPVGWLHVGCHKDVPAGSCYKAHCGDTWVWVMPDGMVGLSDFTLVLQDIARVSINSDSLFYWPPPPCVYGRRSASPDKKPPDGGGGGNAVAKEEKKTPADADRSTLEVSVFTDGCNCLVPAGPYRKYRFENLGGDPSFRSAVSAAGSR
jgi:hypothetical protein